MVTDVFIGILARHLRRYVMGAFIIVDISMEYWHILLFIYSYVAINCITKCMFQRRRCCVFDSPGLPNDSAGYPGLTYSLRGTTPSVLCFLWLIHHKIFHRKRNFTEKAQHLRRWISLRTFTRGRRGTSQPRAIKGTTRTELHHEGIYIAKFIHWDNSAIPTLLRGEIIVGVAWLIIKGEMM